MVVDALDAVDLDAEGAAERDTAGHFVRADVSADEAFLSADESDDESDPGASDDASDEARDDANDRTTSRETLEARRAAGYVVGSHLDNMTGGKRTELVVNAADSARRGIRVGVVEDGRLVETWYEDSAGPGEGMRVGDVYLGVVAKVIGGMQGVLVDVTGKGPPYSLMQKGVDEPALAWREADAGYERELEMERMEKADSEKPDAARAENEGDEGRGSARLDGTSPGAPSVLPNQSPEPEGTLTSEARLARLERKAAASAIGSRAGGRWADAWAEGVGVSDSFDGERVAAGSSSAETVAASLETFAEERPDAAAGVATVAPFATFDAVGETRAPPPFAWAPWRRGGGAARTAEAAARTDEPLREEDAASSTRAAASSGAPDSSAPHSGVPDHAIRAPLTAAERRDGRGVVEDWVPGMPVVVQVTRLGSGHKGPRVTARPTLPGRNVVLCPDGEGVYVSRKLAGAARAYVKSVGAEVAPPDCALIMRTEAAGVSKEVLATDITSPPRTGARYGGARKPPPRRPASTAAADAAPAAGRGHHGADPRAGPVRRARRAPGGGLEACARRHRGGPAPDGRHRGDDRQGGAVRARRARTGFGGGARRRSEAPGDDGVLGAARKNSKEREVWDALGLRDAIVSAESERVWLSARDLPGAHLVIQRTEALTAVDVNAGPSRVQRRGEHGERRVRGERRAAAEMAAQLRLRDVGGLVMVDFIDMAKRKHRRAVEAAFLEAAKHDRAQVTFLPISPLGVMEVARERLQGNHAGRHVVADEKGMPVDPGRPSGGPRRVRGPRPPPWARGRDASGSAGSDATAARRKARDGAAAGAGDSATRAAGANAGTEARSRTTRGRFTAARDEGGAGARPEAVRNTRGPATGREHQRREGALRVVRYVAERFARASGPL